jgi:hypothetical protein
VLAQVFGQAPTSASMSLGQSPIAVRSSFRPRSTCRHTDGPQSRAVDPIAPRWGFRYPPKTTTQLHLYQGSKQPRAKHGAFGRPP